MREEHYSIVSLQKEMMVVYKTPQYSIVVFVEFILISN